MRRPIIAANWKMQKTGAEARAFAEAFVPAVKGANAELVIAPPFTALESLAAALQGSDVALAAQNVYFEEKGAFTGEIAPGMLAVLGCRYAIVGHSERRTLFGETSAQVARKAAALLAHDIRPIVCVGESDAEREAGRTLEVVGSQVDESLSEVPDARALDVVLAYEPIWAIGTGKTATPQMAQDVHALVRARLRARFGDDGDAIRIQYGGSVKPDNAAELMAQPDIDGALVGGASLEPEGFARIALYDRPGS